MSPCRRSSCACSGRLFGSTMPSAVAARPRVAPGAVARGTLAPRTVDQQATALAGAVASPPAGEARRPLREVERRLELAARGENRSCRGSSRRPATGVGRPLRCRRALRATLPLRALRASLAASLESRFAHRPRARARRRSVLFAHVPSSPARSGRATRTRPPPALAGRGRQRRLGRAKAEPPPERQNAERASCTSARANAASNSALAALASSVFSRASSAFQRPNRAQPLLGLRFKSSL